MRHSWYRDDKRSEAAVDARSKRTRDPEPSRSETQDRRPAAGRATVLGLQRAAGNCAVSRLLGDPMAGTASAAFRPQLASRLTAPTVRTIQRKPNLQPVQHAKVKDHAMGRMVGKLTALKKTADPAKWIRSVLEHWCGEYSKQGAPPLTFNDDDVGVLLQWLVNEYLPWWDHGEFDEVMANLQRKGGNRSTSTASSRSRTGPRAPSRASSQAAP
jgi:hypothetical protein